MVDLSIVMLNYQRVGQMGGFLGKFMGFKRTGMGIQGDVNNH